LEIVSGTGAVVAVGAAVVVVVHALVSRAGPIGKLVSFARGVMTKRAERTEKFVSARIAPVEDYLAASFAHYDRIGGMLCMWGRDEPIKERQAERIRDFANDALDDMAKRGRAAGAAARLADNELFKRVIAADSVGASLCMGLTLCSVGETPAQYIDWLAKGRAADDRVRDRVRALIG
jgi:hypothetical protein